MLVLVYWFMPAIENDRWKNLSKLPIFRVILYPKRSFKGALWLRFNQHRTVDRYWWSIISHQLDCHLDRISHFLLRFVWVKWLNGWVVWTLHATWLYGQFVLKLQPDWVGGLDSRRKPGVTTWLGGCIDSKRRPGCLAVPKLKIQAGLLAVWTVKPGLLRVLTRNMSQNGIGTPDKSFEQQQKHHATVRSVYRSENTVPNQ